MARKNYNGVAIPDGWKKFEDMYNRFNRIPACDEQQSDGQTSCDGIVRAMQGISRGKNFNESCYTQYIYKAMRIVCLIVTDKVFLSRVTVLTRDIDIAILSVCLSIHPSVRHVSVLYLNGLTYCHSFFTTR